VRRLIAILAALAAALVYAPAAVAAVPMTYTVNDPGSAPDADPNVPACADASGKCTLNAAIQQANANPGPDTINFTGAGRTPTPATALAPIKDPVTIDGEGATTVTFDGAAVGPLVDVQAGNSTLRGITFTGGSGTVVKLGGSGDRLDTVTVSNAPGTGVQVVAGSVRVDSPRIDTVGGAGIVVGAPNATISSPEISGGKADGIQVSGDGASISSGRIHGNAGNGVTMTGQNDSVSHVVFFANGGKPVANGPGANGGIAPPGNLRIGPRRPDGSLPLTGTSAAGTVELWSGDPSAAAEPGFVDAFGVSGDFTYNFAAEPAPGRVFAASVTGGGLGTSEFTTVAVPSDVVSPVVMSARALDTSTVRVDASEPLDPASVQKDDFTLTMAGVRRTIDSVSVAPDGRFVTLTSSGWKAGEAGSIDLGGPGAIADTAGNASLAPARLRVFAAPGDFVAPLGARLAISPKTICLTRGHGCSRPGMTIKFVSTEDGKAMLVVRRGDALIGRRLYGNIVAGANTLKFNGRLGARKLRAGRYRLLMYVQDQVGNVTDQPPIQLFSVRRVSK
jgi:hypothetical protein